MDRGQPSTSLLQAYLALTRDPGSANAPAPPSVNAPLTRDTSSVIAAPPSTSTTLPQKRARSTALLGNISTPATRPYVPPKPAVPPSAPPAAPSELQPLPSFRSAAAMLGRPPRAQRASPDDVPDGAFVPPQQAAAATGAGGGLPMPGAPQRTLGSRRVYQPPYQPSAGGGGGQAPLPGGGGGVRMGRVLSAVGGGQPGGVVRERGEVVDERTPPDDFPPSLLDEDGLIPHRLVPIDVQHLKAIMSEVVQPSGNVSFEEIAGLSFAKQAVMESVVWPMRQPQLFSGLRSPPRGLLLFGPPGTGKTLIGRAIAASLQCHFFAISASSLMSKWIGEGERMVRALFAVAGVLSPAVVFVDEIDSLLSKRQDGENDGSRRVKNEFLVQMEGATTSTTERVVLVGATNRPHELDEAARRRMPKRLYIPLPDAATRRELLVTALRGEVHEVDDALKGPPGWRSVDGGDMRLEDAAGELPPLVELQSLSEFERASECKGSDRAVVLKHAVRRLGSLSGLVAATAGYSGSDLMHLCRDAALGPVRDAMTKAAQGAVGGELPTVEASELRAIDMDDFVDALEHVRPSVNAADLALYETWDAEYGSRSRPAR